MKKEMKIKMTLCVIVIISTLCFSTTQTLAWGVDYTKTISGTVTDTYTVPLSGVKVELIKDGSVVKTRYTGGNGYYSITYTGPSLAIYRLKVSKYGFITKEKPILWRNNYPVTENFLLEAAFPITTTFTGYIYDDIDQTPVYGVLVQLYKQSGTCWNLERFMTTSVDGHYALTSNPATTYPTYKIVVSRKCVEDCRVFSPTYSRTYTENFYVDAFRGHAIIIGISDYEDPYIEDFSPAEAIAYGWYSFLKNEKGFKEFIVFRDDHINLPVQNDFEGNDVLGTRENIYDGVSGIVNEVDSNDYIAFIVTGHGYTFINYYFYAYDSVTYIGLPDPPTCIWFPAIVNSLENPKCSTFFYLDTCDSGKGKYDLECWMDAEALAKSYLVAACEHDATVILGRFYKYFFTLSYQINPHLSLEEIFDMATIVQDPNNENKTYYEETGCIPVESDNNGATNTYL